MLAASFPALPCFREPSLATMPSPVFTFLSLSLIGLTLSLLVRLPAAF